MGKMLNSAKRGEEMFYPKVKSISPLEGYILEVTFDNGIIKRYDFKPELNSFLYEALKEEALFYQPQIQQDGIGVIWGDKIDIAETTLWEYGVAINATLEQVEAIDTQIKNAILQFMRKETLKSVNRNPERIENTLDKLKMIWNQNPSLRFCQLVSLIADNNNPSENVDKDIFYIEDEKFLEGLDRFMKTKEVK